MELKTHTVTRNVRSTLNAGSSSVMSDRYTYGKASSPKAQKVKGHRMKFLRAMKNGDIVVTPHTAYTREVTLPEIKWVASRSQKTGSTWKHWTMENYYSLSDNLNPYMWYEKYKPNWKYTSNELVIMAIAKANEREFDLLTTLAEMPETLKMVRDLYSKLRHPLKSLQEIRDAMRRKKIVKKVIEEVKTSRKGKKYIKRRVIREVQYSYRNAWVSAITLGTEAWLLYRYGILPLVYTIDDALTLLNKTNEELFETAKSRFEEEREINEPLGTIGGQGDGLSAELWISGTITRVARTMVKSRYNIPQLRQKRIALNPVSTLWELTTLSFVVDWLVHVGDVINALTPTCFEKRAITLSEKLSVNLQVYMKSSKIKPSTSTDVYGALALSYEGATFNQMAYTRHVVSDDPWQSLTLPIGLEMNWKRQVDAFALTWPALRNLFSGLQNIIDLPFNRNNHD